MAKSKVALIRTKPETVMDDIARAYELGGAKQALQAGATTILKDNISWHFPMPSSNTTPWGLEGTVLGLRGMGFEDLVVVEHRTVVTQTEKGDRLCRFRPVIDAGSGHSASRRRRPQTVGSRGNSHEVLRSNGRGILSVVRTNSLAEETEEGFAPARPPPHAETVTTRASKTVTAPRFM